MTLSPRVRVDFLLLYPAPTPHQCLEAYATANGVEFCAPYPNILRKAATVFPQLPQLVADHVPPALIADSVCAVLDGVLLDASELPLPEHFLGE